jgi:hypothetical protein
MPSTSDIRPHLSEVHAGHELQDVIEALRRRITDLVGRDHTDTGRHLLQKFGTPTGSDHYLLELGGVLGKRARRARACNDAGGKPAHVNVVHK